MYDLVWFTNFEVGYGTHSYTHFHKDEPLFDVKYKGYNFNKAFGLIYEVTDWLDVGWSFNHDTGHHETKFLNQRNFKGTSQYQDIGFTLNIKGVKPSVTYTYRDFNYLEFGLSFDF